MKLNRFTRIAFILVVFGVLVAYGSNYGGSNRVTLAQSIVSTPDLYGNVVRLNFPEGWRVAILDIGQIMFGSTQAVLNAFTSSLDTIPALQSGQVGGQVTAGPLSDLLGLGVPEGASATEILDILFLQNPVESFSVSAPQSAILNEKDAAIATGSALQGGVTMDVTLVGVVVNDGLALLIFGAPRGQITQYDAIIRAIAGSVTYGPAG